MDLEQILAGVDELSPDDLDRLKQYLAQKQQAPARRTVENWMAEFHDIVKEFRGDSSDEEMKQVIEAMTLKNNATHQQFVSPLGGEDTARALQDYLRTRQNNQ